jgi:hypothetical protein
MNADNFVEWLLRQGRKIIKTPTSYWLRHNPGVYQAFPYHWILQPSEDELYALLKDQHAVGLRYSTSIDSNLGARSYHVVLDKKDYSVAGMPKKSRHDVERGIKNFCFEPIKFERLAHDDGWKLRFETLMRQGRTRAETSDWWKMLCLSAVGLPGFEAWGALTKEGQLAASLISFTCDDCVSILYHQSSTAHLSNGVNNALAYTFTQKSMQNGKWIFYGLHSLDAPPSVDAFKFRMGYSAKPVRQRVAFHPGIAPLFNPISHTFLRAAHRLNPSSEVLAKTEGLTRFYLHGKITSK